jgi:hypothetical protein
MVQGVLQVFRRRLGLKDAIRQFLFSETTSLYVSAAASEPQELLRKFIIVGQGHPSRLYIEKVPSVLGVNACSAQRRHSSA